MGKMVHLKWNLDNIIMMLIMSIANFAFAILNNDHIMILFCMYYHEQVTQKKVMQYCCKTAVKSQTCLKDWQVYGDFTAKSPQTLPMWTGIYSINSDRPVVI